jgi:hypothetical protein
MVEGEIHRLVASGMDIEGDQLLALIVRRDALRAAWLPREASCG